MLIGDSFRSFKALSPLRDEQSIVRGDGGGVGKDIGVGADWDGGRLEYKIITIVYKEAGELFGGGRNNKCLSMQVNIYLLKFRIKQMKLKNNFFY